MNILFAGSPKSSSKILKYLAGLKEVHIKGVITQPDKRGKRGGDLKDSEVSKVANALHLKVLKPVSLDERIFKDEIESLDTDFLVVVAYGKLLPKWLLRHPKIMAVNVHFSILPIYRGASPIQSALINGDNQSGVSFMQITEALDEGPVILKKSLEINKDDNKITLEEKLTDLSIKNILKVLVDLKKGSITPSEQNHSLATYCTKISKDDSLIDFKDSATNIINKFKAYFEWPGLSFIHRENRIKIHEISIVNEKSNGIAGSFNRIDSSGIYFNTIDFVVVITYLQFPNKNVISSLDAFNSYRSFFE